MFSKDTFCSMPWSSIQINPTGDFKICCFSGVSDPNQPRTHGMCVDDDGKIMNILTHSFEDALNSKVHKELRIAHSKNERHPVCAFCWRQEDAFIAKNQQPSSLRIARSTIHLRNLDNAIHIDNVAEKFSPDGSLYNEMPISLDLRFTNKCNMKCVMCSPRYSNLWYEDYTKLYNRDNFSLEGKTYKIIQENGTYKSDFEAWHDSPIWWEKFNAIKDRVRHIYITGGEPFLIKGHDDLLDNLIESGHAPNVMLEYDTNLSVINDNILDKLSQFKDVSIAVSVDSIGEEYGIVRFPGNFDRLTENLAKLKERGLKVRRLTGCIGVHSMLSPIKIYNYFKPRGYDNYSFRFLREPSHSDVTRLPDEIKLQLIHIYRNSNFHNYWKQHYIGTIENSIGQYKPEKCEQSAIDFVNYMNSLDELRGTNWKETIKDVANLLHKYI